MQHYEGINQTARNLYHAHTTVEYANDYDFRAHPHRGQLQCPLQSVYKWNKDCHFKECELFFRAIFCMYKLSMPPKKNTSTIRTLSDFNRGRIDADRNLHIGCSQTTDMKI